MTEYSGKASPNSGSGSGGGSITVDQTYDATSTNAQSGTAVAEAVATITTFTGATISQAGSVGLVPAPTIGNRNMYLKGDGTWGTVIQNDASGTFAFAIGIGASASGSNAYAYGHSANAQGSKSLSLGYYATAKQDKSYQIGQGINNTSNSLQVESYQMLDLTTGKIPNDRINVDANPTQNSTNFVTSGTIYDVLGNINTLLSQI